MTTSTPTEHLMRLALATLLAFIVLALPTNGRAAYSAEVFANYSNCLVGCDATQDQCNGGCCFLGLCSKRCLSNCASQETVCQEGCSNTYFGGTSGGAFFAEGTIDRDGRTVHLGGPFQCPEGAVTDLEVRLTQTGSGAVGVGNVRIACPAGPTTFSVDVHTSGAAGFHGPSVAEVCGAAKIHARAQSIDAFQWCREVLLVPEGLQVEDDQ